MVLKKEVIANMRAMLLSVKGGTPLRLINEDYVNCFYQDLPYQEIGYESIEDLIFQNDEDFLLIGPRNNKVVKAIPKASSAHIAELVARQKSPRKRERRSFQHAKPTNACGFKYRKNLPPRFKTSMSNGVKESYNQKEDEKVDIPCNENWDDELLHSKSDIPEETFKNTTYPQQDIAIALPSYSNTSDSTPCHSKWEENDIFQDFPDLDEPDPPAKPSLFFKRGFFQKIKTVNPTAPDENDSLQQLEQLSLSSKPSSASRLPIGEDDVTYTLESKLKEKCIKMGLPEPTFKFSDVEKMGKKGFFCLIKVGSDLQFRSESFMHESEFIAQENAVRTAIIVFDELLMLPSQKRDFMLNVYAMISYKTVGIWIAAFEEYYEKVYHKKPINDWLNILTGSPLFDVGGTGNTSMIILAKLNNGENSHNQRTEVSAMFPRPVVTETPETPRRVSESHHYKKLKPLNLPTSDFWDIHITDADTKSTLWCQLIGEEHSDKYHTVMTNIEMETMQGNGVPVKHPLVDHLYLLFNEHTWSRVRLLKIQNRECIVSSIDYSGVDEIVDVGQLYELNGKYLDLPAQALRLYLHNLEDVELDPDFLVALIGVSYIAQVFNVSSKNGTINAYVCLFDTSSNDDVNINEVLMERCLRKFPDPKLPGVNQAEAMYINHIDTDGVIYLVLTKDINERIMDILINMFTYGKIKPLSIIEVNAGILCIARSRGRLMRVKVVMVHSNLIQCYCVDYGYNVDVPLSDLYKVTNPTHLVTRIPFQTVKAQLAGLSFSNDNTVSHIIDLLPINELVTIKVTHNNNLEIPSVQIFKSFNNRLTCVNSIIPRPSPIKTVKLPNVANGSVVTVRVRLTANPSNFMIQLLDTWEQLQELMCKLQEYGTNIQQSLKSSEVAIKGIYVCLYETSWYRCRVETKHGSNNCLVHLIDFGDIVESCVFKPITDEFLMLPQQSVIGKLHEVRPPLSVDWDTFECLMFKELTEGKDFMATVVNSEVVRDELRLELQLFDTSRPDVDVDINRKFLLLLI